MQFGSTESIWLPQKIYGESFIFKFEILIKIETG